MKGSTELNGEPIGIIFGKSMKVREGMIYIRGCAIDNGSIMDCVDGIIGIIPLGSRYKFIKAGKQS